MIIIIVRFFVVMFRKIKGGSQEMPKTTLKGTPGNASWKISQQSA